MLILNLIKFHYKIFINIYKNSRKKLWDFKKISRSSVMLILCTIQEKMSKKSLTIFVNYSIDITLKKIWCYQEMHRRKFYM